MESVVTEKKAAAHTDKKTEQAMACCGATGEHCGMAHQNHADINK